MISTARFLFVFALAVVYPPMTGTAADPLNVGPLRLISPWARATPVSFSSTVHGAAFVEISNTGAEPDWLIAADSTAAMMAGIHETTMVDGIMKMRPIDRVEIPAGGSILLRPGGPHIMLMNLTAPLRKGATISVSLTFEKAGRIDLAILVAAIGARAAPRNH